MIAAHLSYVSILTIPLPLVMRGLSRRPKPAAGVIAAIIGYSIAMLLPLAPAASFVLPVILTACIPIYTVLVQRFIRNSHLAGSLLLLLNLGCIIFIFGSPDLISGYSPLLLAWLRRLSETNLVAAAVSPDEIETVLFFAAGIVLVSVGLNDPIAFFLKRAHLMPGSAEGIGSTEKILENSEPARGRVIGYLERAIILVLMLTENIGAIGFVLAAKGFTRFKQLDDRDFAEYVLIGTLLSTGVTMLTGIVLAGFR